eukprot:2738672-Prymnesium_polylepis.1
MGGMACEAGQATVHVEAAGRGGARSSEAGSGRDEARPGPRFACHPGPPDPRTPACDRAVGNAVAE